jgi:hypothetical protein
VCVCVFVLVYFSSFWSLCVQGGGCFVCEGWGGSAWLLVRSVRLVVELELNSSSDYGEDCVTHGGSW